MWAIYEKEVITGSDKTFAFTSGYEIDRDSAFFQFSHSQDSIEIFSNGYTRLISKENNTVEYGSNSKFEGVMLKHKPNRIIKYSLFSFLKLAYFSFFVVRNKKNLSVFNLNRLDKILFRKNGRNKWN